MIQNNYILFSRKWFPNQIRKISQGKISLEKSATGQDGRAAVLQKKQSKKEFKVGQFWYYLVVLELGCTGICKIHKDWFKRIDFIIIEMSSYLLQSTWWFTFSILSISIMEM